MFVWDYFCILCSVSLIQLFTPLLKPHSLYYCSSINLEILQAILLLYYSFSNCFPYSSSFGFLYTFQKIFFCTSKNSAGILIEISNIKLNLCVYSSRITSLFSLPIHEHSLSICFDLLFLPQGYAVFSIQILTRFCQYNM